MTDWKYGMTGTWAWGTGGRGRPFTFMAVCHAPETWQTIWLILILDGQHGGAKPGHLTTISLDRHEITWHE